VTSPRTGIDVELGSPGVAARPPVAPPIDAPRVELGAAGTSAKAEPPPRSGLGADLLGPAGQHLKPTVPVPAIPSSISSQAPMTAVPQVRGVSEDLSDQMAIRVDDVKEAVRASKVMRSVDLPPDVQAALDSAEVTPPPVMDPPRLPKTPVPPIADSRPTARPVSQPVPRMPTPMPVAEEASRTSPILIVLLVLVILGGGAFALWKYVLSNKSDTTKTDVGEPTQPVGTGGSAGSVVPPPPPPPPAIVGELRMVAAPPVDVTAAVGGTIATIVEDGATVAIGDRIAKLGGAEKWENKLRTATFQVNRKTKDVSEAKLRLEAAQKDGNQKEIGQRQVALEDNEESLAKYTEDKADAESELAKYTLSAPVAGAIKLATSKGKRVVANDVVAQIVTPAVPMVTFDLPSSRTLTVDQPVRLITGENNALACTVAEVEGQKATVKCPVDGAPPDGAKVTLQ
jgi:hypothetical protein